MSKNFDETVQFQSEKKQEWIREVREDRLQGLQRTQLAHPVWPAYQPHLSLGETCIQGSIVA